MATLSQLQGLILYLTKGLGSATLSAIESRRLGERVNHSGTTKQPNTR